MDAGRQIVDLEAALAEIGGGGGSLPEQIVVTADVDGLRVTFAVPPTWIIEHDANEHSFVVFDENGEKVSAIDITSIDGSPGETQTIVQSQKIFLNGAGLIVGDLPLVDPAAAGRLWNDAGVLKISAG